MVRGIETCEDLRSANRNPKRVEWISGLHSRADEPKGRTYQHCKSKQAHGMNGFDARCSCHDVAWAYRPATLHRFQFQSRMGGVPDPACDRHQQRNVNQVR